MRLKYALPLLSSAAAFMVIGLSLASAQPPNRPSPQRVQVRPPGTGTPAGTPPPTKQTPSGADQFQTGIEFEPIPPSTRVTFNLEDADLPDLVRLISSITGKRFKSALTSLRVPTLLLCAKCARLRKRLNGMMKLCR